MENNKEHSVFINCWWRKSLISVCKLSCSAQNIYPLTSLSFFSPGTQSSKGHKTFLRKEAVDARVQEIVWIWTSESFPKKFLLFPCVFMGLIPWLWFHYVGLVSVRWTCCPYLWKAIPYHLYCPGFCPQGLEKFDWLGGDLSKWKCWPLRFAWIGLAFRV